MTGRQEEHLFPCDGYIILYVSSKYILPFQMTRTMGPQRSQFRSAACCSSRPVLKGNTTSTRFWLMRCRSRLIVSRTCAVDQGPLEGGLW